MIFASNLFLLYFLPVFLLVYWAMPYRFRNYTALAGSLLFYAWGAPIFVFVLITSSAADYLLSLWLVQESNAKKKWWLAFAGIAYNLGLLLYFKYVNFFIGNWNEVLDVMGFQEVEWTKAVIPLGISFFTFQKISYLIDISRKVKTPPANSLDYLLYVSYFPQLVAGPIVRYNEIADQIEDRREQDNLQLRWSGMVRFCIGLARKVLIANPLSMYVQDLVQMPGDALTPGLAWLGPFIFAFVIYHDFGGYSDMAIGLGRMMGFKLPENFNNPYTAASITDFWRRWHISLTGWFRTYVFWPSRKLARHKWMLNLNLWLVFLLVGFWHGPAWTFVLFGMWHGTWILIEHYWLGKWLQKLPRPISIAWTFFIVVVGIVPFMSPDLAAVSGFYEAMLGLGENVIPTAGANEIQFGLKFWTLMLIGGLSSFWAVFPGVVRFQKTVDDANFAGWRFYALSGLGFLLLILSASELARVGFQPFIYFMF